MKQASFDPTGEKLWIIVTMKGLYFMPYNYQLLGTGLDEPAVLTNPLRTNNNKVKIDDFFQIVNDFNTGDPISKYHERVTEVTIDIVKMADDFGYEVSVGIWQTDEGNLGVIINELNNDDDPFIEPLLIESRKGKVGTKRIKEERFFFQLIDKTK